MISFDGLNVQCRGLNDSTRAETFWPGLERFERLKRSRRGLYDSTRAETFWPGLERFER